MNATRSAQKARPAFRHTTGTKQTVTGKPQVTVFAPGSGWAAASTGPRKAPRKTQTPKVRGVEYWPGWAVVGLLCGSSTFYAVEPPVTVGH